MSDSVENITIKCKNPDKPNCKGRAGYTQPVLLEKQQFKTYCLYCNFPQNIDLTDMDPDNHTIFRV